MFGEIVIWYAMIVFIGVAAFPIVSMVCKNLNDRGYCISKIAGILMLTYLTWILSYVLHFSRNTVLLSMAIVCAVSLLCVIKNRVKIDRGVVIRNEILFLIVFAVFLMIRAYNPEISTFGEKFMDFAFLNAVMRTDHFPPHDPWFSGGLLNFYYYFGYLTVAVLSKLSGISTTVTYNLGLVTFAAVAANAGFGIGYNLTGKMRYGIWTMIFIVFIANPYIVFNIAGNLLHLPTASRVQLFGFWASTRVIPNTINEFPYFSFIFGDLHSHVMSIPFQLLVLMLMLNIYKSRDGGLKTVETIAFALCIGALFPMNAWDYPTYLILFTVIMFARQYRAAHQPFHKRLMPSAMFHWRSAFKSCLSGGIWLYNSPYVKKALIPIVIVVILSIFLFIPFHLDFQGSGASGIKITHQKTLLINFIEMFALFLFLIFSFLFLHLDFDKKYVIALIPITILSLLFFQILLITVPLIVLCIYLLFNQNVKNNSFQFVLILILIGTMLAIFCEIFYLNDRLGVPNERMNTVFKLYLQIWILWGIAAGYCVYSIKPLLDALSSRIRTIWTIIFCVIIVSCCIYPFTATSVKMTLDQNPPSLDGIEYMNESDRGDLLAILWMRKKITGAPVIIEAPGKCYSTDSRVSAFTGLPAVIGWTGHERMWRRDWDDISIRTEDVNEIYDTQDINTAIDLLNKYNVSYIYVGTTEHARYGRGLHKFENEDYFECVYIGSVRIYEYKRFTKV